MWQLAASLWHELSPEEVEEWERAGTTRGMTGFAWYMSQALRPNPGIYLPLAGGNMTGIIDMQGNYVRGLPFPADIADAARKGYVDAMVREAVTRPSVRARRTTNQTIPHNTVTAVIFDMEDHDNDFMWEGITHPERITITTPGIYIILGQVQWAASAAGYRGQLLQHSSAGLIAQTHTQQSASINLWRGNVATTWDCEVGDYIELIVIQTSTLPLDCVAGGKQAPVLEAIRAG